MDEILKDIENVKTDHDIFSCRCAINHYRIHSGDAVGYAKLSSLIAIKERQLKGLDESKESHKQLVLV